MSDDGLEHPPNCLSMFVTAAALTLWAMLTRRPVRVPSDRWGNRWL